MCFFFLGLIFGEARAIASVTDSGGSLSGFPKIAITWAKSSKGADEHIKELPYKQTSKSSTCDRGTKQAVFVCKCCGRPFTYSSACKIHERRHRGEKPYKCHYCSKGFSTSNEAKLHERKHTGVKPYSCKFCGRRFSDGSNWRKHEKKCPSKVQGLPE